MGFGYGEVWEKGRAERFSGNAAGDILHLKRVKIAQLGGIISSRSHNSWTLVKNFGDPAEPGVVICL
jgi:hypothetical protein